MKLYVIGLIAFATLLGTGCKKDEVKPQEQKIELVRPQAKADIGGYTDGPSTFPHNTGACTCGKYPGCHPKQPAVIRYYDSEGFGHVEPTK